MDTQIEAIIIQMHNKAIIKMLESFCRSLRNKNVINQDNMNLVKNLIITKLKRKAKKQYKKTVNSTLIFSNELFNQHEKSVKKNKKNVQDHSTVIIQFPIEEVAQEVAQEVVQEVVQEATQDVQEVVQEVVQEATQDVQEVVQEVVQDMIPVVTPQDSKKNKNEKPKKNRVKKIQTYGNDDDYDENMLSMDINLIERPKKSRVVVVDDPVYNDDDIFD